MIMKKESKDLIKVKDFLLKYKDTYENYEDFIINNFYNEIGSKSSIINSIKSYLNLSTNAFDIYRSYFEFLKNNYDLTGNILEVASGPFPTISKYIDDYQKEKNKGSIEAYDPILVNATLGNIKLNKKRFDDNIVLSDKNLIFSMAPCSFTKELISISNKNKKDFSILLCSCLFNHFRSQDEYLKYLLRYSMMSNKDDSIINITYLDGDDKYPIIYKKNSNF